MFGQKHSDSGAGLASLMGGPMWGSLTQLSEAARVSLSRPPATDRSALRHSDQWSDLGYVDLNHFVNAECYGVTLASV